MDELLKRLDLLEKRVAFLENGNCVKDLVSWNQSIDNFIVDNNDLDLVYRSSMIIQVIRLLKKCNEETPFLKWKRVLYTENGILTDEQLEEMFLKIENKLINLHKKIAKELKPEDFFEKAEIVYNLNIKKQFKKIKSEFLKSL